jgi:hypothetical protein
MKYSVLASAKKKKLLKKLKGGTSSTHAVLLPPRPMTTEEANNIRPTCQGDNFVRDFQYPQTIRAIMREMENYKFNQFIEELRKNPLEPSKAFEATDARDYSPEGCLRWVYQHRFFNDGQERYEAADDVSFDVRGNFCYRCEMARRLVELRPIAFEAPAASDPYPEFVSEGYTRKHWTWGDEPAQNQCTLFSLDEEVPETPNGDFVCELSSDLFRALLTMVQSAGNNDYQALRETATSYRCGARRVYVFETENNHTKQPTNELDYQMDIVDGLRELATPRKVNDRGVDVSIIVSEINPFVVDEAESHRGSSIHLSECFYNPRMVVNQVGRVIHSMSVKLSYGPGNPSYLFVCPEVSHGLVRYDMALRGDQITTFPDNELYYPTMFYGKSHLTEVILYSVMYLMERTNNGEFSRVVNEKPEEFYKICRRAFNPHEAEFYRKRLVLHKRNGKVKNYPSTLKAIRNSFLGLSTIRP